MAQVSFYKINNSQLSSLAIKEGQIIFVQDTGKLYIDKDSSNRISVGGSSYSAGEGINISGTTISSKNSNIINGSTSGSLRMVNSVAESSSYTIGQNAFAEGNNTTASGDDSHAEGNDTTASGEKSHAEGLSSIAFGRVSHAEGNNTEASGDNSHAEGLSSTASGGNSHAEGASTTALGDDSHAEGHSTTASGNYSHAEGFNTTAQNSCSHAEGNNTEASGEGSHAEGWKTIASGENSHAEGWETTSQSNCSHAEGRLTIASGDYSHAEGYYTTASGEDQHVQGKWNIADTTSAHIVGNGAFKNLSNAHTLDWEGNAWFAGDVYTGSTSGTNKDDGSKKLATEEYVTNLVRINNAGFHNSIFRGKDVTAYHTDGTLYTRISSGEFDDLFVGDYIIVNNITWRIAGFDIHLNKGDHVLKTHHAVIVPDSTLTSGAMNSEGSTEGGYVASLVYQNDLPTVLTNYITPVFGNHVIEYRASLTNGINPTGYNRTGKNDGCSDSYDLYSRKLDLMDECEVYGSAIWSSSGFDCGSAYTQLPLFALAPQYILSDGPYWLKDVSTSHSYASVNAVGMADRALTSSFIGVRPRFLID